MPFGLFGKGSRKDSQGTASAAVPEQERDPRLQQISVGTDVSGSDGEALGKIKEIGRDYILVIEGRSSMRRPKYIPVNWITTIGHSKITLSKNTRWLMDNDLTRPPKAQIGAHGRREPLMGAESAQPNFNRESPTRGRTRGPKPTLAPMPQVVRTETSPSEVGAAVEE